MKSRNPKVRKATSAYKSEPRYGSAKPMLIRGEQIVLDAHELLDYARMRAEVARYIESLVRDHPQSALVGFLTGSIGLSVNARMLVERLIPGQVRFVDGMSQRGVKRHRAERDYHANLDDLYSRGVRHVILIDELKSGGQMRANLESTATWLGRSEKHDIVFSIVGVRGGTPAKKDVTAEKLAINKKYKSIPVMTAKTFYAMRLLEMDEPGLQYRAVKRTGTPGEYVFARSQPEKGLLVRCHEGGAVGGIGASSLDQAFGALVTFILGSSTTSSRYFWPGKIYEHSCGKCRRLLSDAQEAYQNGKGRFP